MGSFSAPAKTEMYLLSKRAISMSFCRRILWEASRSLLRRRFPAEKCSFGQSNIFTAFINEIQLTLPLAVIIGLRQGFDPEYLLDRRDDVRGVNKAMECSGAIIRRLIGFSILGGKCADLNAWYVGLARAAGIPARDAYGMRCAH
jgi:hypothetical protein